jgi:pyroglutamyl-peptidase
MKRAILTGFEPFGPYKYNPVQDTAREYNRKILGDIEIIGLVLPCTYYGAFKLLSEKIDELSPDIIIGSGLASRIQRIRLEAFGRNVMNGKYPDNEGRKADNEPIIKDGNLLYQTTSNSILLASALYDSGISAEVSIDAEGFICNSLIYLTAKRISDENIPIRFAFFHTPWTEDYLDRVNLESGKVTIKKNNLRRTIELLVRNVERNI